MRHVQVALSGEGPYHNEVAKKGPPQTLSDPSVGRRRHMVCRTRRVSRF
jgi:hypothetical protein